MGQNHAAFELAVRSFSGDLYRYAYWLSRNPTDAEDLVQECFQRAWRSWHTLKDDQAVKQWLLKILRREFLRRFDKTIPVFTDLEEADLIPITTLGYDDAYAVRQAIHQAPVHLREALVLQVIGGFSCEEIAEIQGTSSGAVMTRLTRARQWLKASLSDQGLRKGVLK